jgi:hypothetical protein
MGRESRTRKSQVSPSGSRRTQEGEQHYLTLLLAAGGALALTERNLGVGGRQALALGLFLGSVYLFMLSAIVLVKCLSLRDMPSPTNEPSHLYQPTFTFDQVREGELKNITFRIKAAVKLNRERSDWLNRLRRWPLAAPEKWSRNLGLVFK